MLEIAALLVGAIANSLLALVTFAKNQRSATNVLFIFLVISLVGWTITNYSSLHTSSNLQTLGWIRNILFFVVLQNTSFFLLVRVFPEVHFSFLKNRWVIFAIIYSIITIAVTETPFLFTDFKDGSPVPGLGMLLFIPHALIFAAGGLIWLIIRYIKATGVLRKQLEYFLAGTLLLYTIVPLNNFILPVFFKNSLLVALSPIYPIIFTASVSYAILRHRFLDIRVIVAKSVAYALVLLTVAAIYAAAIFSISNLVLNNKITLTNQQSILYITIAIIVSLTFQPLQTIFTKLTDRIFFKDAYDVQDLLRRLSTIMATNFKLDSLLGYILSDLVGTMRLSKGSFVLLHENEPYLAKAYGFSKSPHYESSAIAGLANKLEVIVYDELPEDGVKHIMKELNAAVAAPLIAEKDFVGLLLLGEKRSGEVYSQQDLKVVEILAPEISIAVANAQAVDQIEKFNVTLKKEVADATAELQRKNEELGKALEELKSLDVMKDQLIAVTSHELKSPASVIKNYLWVVLHEPDQETKLSESDHNKLERSFGSLQNLIHLINDILNVSRIEGGRMSVRNEVVNPGEIIKQTIEDYTIKAQEKGLSLSAFGLEESHPIIADKDKFTEVVVNLISNAIKYTDHGSVVVRVEIKDNKEIFKVLDTGRGIAKENLPHLFEKFYREDSSLSASNAMTGGTGLGLYITKSYVDLMKGEIGFETEKNKGSTFFFSLPLSRSQLTTSRPIS
jgi:signal transduction histidine kinase